MGTRNQTQVLSLGGKHPSLVSHLASLWSLCKKKRICNLKQPSLMFTAIARIGVSGQSCFILPAIQPFGYKTKNKKQKEQWKPDTTDLEWFVFLLCLMSDRDFQNCLLSSWNLKCGGVFFHISLLFWCVRRCVVMHTQGYGGQNIFLYHFPLFFWEGPLSEPQVLVFG